MLELRKCVETSQSVQDEPGKQLASMVKSTPLTTLPLPMAHAPDISGVFRPIIVLHGI